MRWGRDEAVCRRGAGACGSGGHGPETVGAMALVRLLVRLWGFVS